MASDLLNKYGIGIKSLTLIPSGGGVYEVMNGETLIFSKKKLGRFPKLDEIIALLDN